MPDSTFELRFEARGDGFVVTVEGDPPVGPRAVSLGGLRAEGLPSPTESTRSAWIGALTGAARHARPVGIEAPTRTPAAQDFGDRLFDAVFQGDVLLAYRQRRNAAIDGHTRLALAFVDDRCAISGARDGTLRFRDLKSASEVPQLVVLDEGGWLLLTADRYVDGSPEGLARVSLRVGDRVASARVDDPELRNAEVVRQVLRSVTFVGVGG